MADLVVIGYHDEDELIIEPRNLGGDRARPTTASTKFTTDPPPGASLMTGRQTAESDPPARERRDGPHFQVPPDSILTLGRDRPKSSCYLSIGRGLSLPIVRKAGWLTGSCEKADCYHAKPPAEVALNHTSSGGSPGRRAPPAAGECSGGTVRLGERGVCEGRCPDMSDEESMDERPLLDALLASIDTGRTQAHTNAFKPGAALIAPPPTGRAARPVSVCASRRSVSGRVLCRGCAEVAQALGSAELSDSRIRRQLRGDVRRPAISTRNRTRG